YVWATVMRRSAQDRAIVDAGLKALAFDSGPLLICDEPSATYERAPMSTAAQARPTGSTSATKCGLSRPLRADRQRGDALGHCTTELSTRSFLWCSRG